MRRQGEEELVLDRAGVGVCFIPPAPTALASPAVLHVFEDDDRHLQVFLLVRYVSHFQSDERSSVFVVVEVVEKVRQICLRGEEDLGEERKKRAMKD